MARILTLVSLRLPPSELASPFDQKQLLALRQAVRCNRIHVVCHFHSYHSQSAPFSAAPEIRARKIFRRSRERRGRTAQPGSLTSGKRNPNNRQVHLSPHTLWNSPTNRSSASLRKSASV